MSTNLSKITIAEPDGKVCSKCCLWKMAIEFSPRKNRSGGLRSYCLVCSRDASNIYARNNRAELVQKKRDRYLSPEGRASHRRYYEENKERIRSVQKAYEATAKESRNKRRKLARLSNEVYRVSDRVRARLRVALIRRGYSKQTKTQDMIGCDWANLRDFIESKFAEGMTWDNYGQWHIDHKIPLASAKSEAEVIALCHYTNLQPLWAVDNLRKGARV